MIVTYEEHEHIINSKLLVSRGVTQNLFKIIKIRHHIMNLFEVQDTSSYEGRDVLFLKLLTEAECDLQSEWGYKRDPSYHMRQFYLKRCTCPVMDNKDRIGVDQWVFNSDCPYHGNKND